MDEFLKTRLTSTTNRFREVEGYLRMLRGARAYPEVLRELGLEERLDAQGDVVLGRPRDAERIPVVLAQCPLDELWAIALHALPRESRAAARAAWSARVENLRERLADEEIKIQLLASGVRYRQAELAGAVAGVEHTEASSEHATAELRRSELELEIERRTVADLERRYTDAVAEVAAWRADRGSVLHPQDMSREELLVLLSRIWPAGEVERAIVVWSLRAERAGLRRDHDARDHALAQVVAWGGGVDTRA